MDSPKSNDSTEGKGARYPDEIWELIKLAWASAGGISYQKALDMVAANTKAKLPSKGAVARMPNVITGSGAIPDANFGVLGGALTDANNRMLLASQSTRERVLPGDTPHPVKGERGSVGRAGLQQRGFPARL